MFDLGMNQFFFQMIGKMLKEVMPGANYECQFTVCDRAEKKYTSILNTYYGDFEIFFDNGDDASDYVIISPPPQQKEVPNPEGDYSGSSVPTINVDVIPMQIGVECYINVNPEKLKDWFDNYEKLGKINFKMQSVYPMEGV